MSQPLSELFVLNPETQMVDLNRPWISTIKEFRVLLQRDKGTKGDKAGKKKTQAEKEFTFIYHLVDYRSQFSQYSEKDRLQESLRNAGLDLKFDYTKDEELLQAVEIYRVFKETADLLLLQELRQGLHASSRVVRKIRQNLEELLDQADLLTPEQVKELGGKNDLIITISERMDRIMQITQDLPKTLKAITQLEESIKKDLSDIPQLRGKDEKGFREDAISAVPQLANPFNRNGQGF
jgi:5-bromo-4-chloroindolyl phosphate hydrolysis protein